MDQHWYNLCLLINFHHLGGYLPHLTVLVVPKYVYEDVKVGVHLIHLVVLIGVHLIHHHILLVKTSAKSHITSHVSHVIIATHILHISHHIARINQNLVHSLYVTEFLLEFFDCFVLEAEDLFEENCWECELALDYAVSLFCAVFVGAFLNDLDDFLTLLLLNRTHLLLLRLYKIPKQLAKNQLILLEYLFGFQVALLATLVCWFETRGLILLGKSALVHFYIQIL